MRIVSAQTMEELQDAIVDSEDGDVICVPPGFQFHGGITIRKDYITDEIVIVSATGIKHEVGK